MRLHILSDLHLEHASFEMPSMGSDVLLLAGDIHAPGRRAVAWAASDTVSRKRPVVFVAGNHEFYDARYQVERSQMKLAAQGMGIHYLDRATVVIDGVRFIGCTLWTDFKLPIQTRSGPVSDAVAGMAACALYLVDYRAIHWDAEDGTRLLRAEDTLAMHILERDWLRREVSKPYDGKTVVVTHHAPHVSSLAAQYQEDWASTGFVTALPDEFFSVPTLWVHGHTHTRFDYRVGGCRVVCNPRSYRKRDGLCGGPREARRSCQDGAMSALRPAR